MPVVKMKPTSAGQRAMVKVVNPDLHKGKPFAGLVEPQSATAGRNNLGRITTRHRGGGHKQHYRVIDFRRLKDGIPAKVERIEYDPNRSAHIALLCYADGERRYIIAPKGLEVGATLMSGPEAPIRSGNALPIRNIPVGSTIHCIEMLPGKGLSLPGPRAAVPSFSLVRAAMLSFAFAPVRFVAFMWNVVQPSAKLVTENTIFASLVKPALHVGEVSDPPFVAWP